MTLLRARLLQAFLFDPRGTACDRAAEYDLLLRWLVGIGVDAWHHSVEFTFAAAAYSLVRLPKLIAEAG